MRPTMQNVAEIAGVSISTVSRVLNNSAKPLASDSTRQQVFEAARRELNYRPNRAARTLATGLRYTGVRATRAQPALLRGKRLGLATTGGSRRVRPDHSSVQRVGRAEGLHAHHSGWGLCDRPRPIPGISGPSRPVARTGPGRASGGGVTALRTPSTWSPR